jgi:hypothetical protein
LPLNFNLKLSLFQFLLSRALIGQIFLVLLEYCSFSLLQYQYQGFSIVLQYKTARLVQPWSQLARWGHSGVLFSKRTTRPPYHMDFLTTLKY